MARKRALKDKTVSYANDEDYKDEVIDIKTTKKARSTDALVERNKELREEAARMLPFRSAYFKKHMKAFRPFVSEAAVKKYTEGVVKVEPLEHKPLTEQPKCIVNGTMRPYQLEGLNWFIEKHDNGVGGLLGDEMGLGKTLQVISFLGYLKHARKMNGPHLIVGPLSILSSWMNEIKRWCPTLRAVRFHGPKVEQQRMIKEVMMGGNFDVCVTTFEMILSAEHFFKTRFTWRYMIIDESHRIKNEKTLAADVLRRITYYGVFLLTGTPMQNNLHELWSLLNFMYPDLFSSSTPFDEAFKLGTNSHVIDAEKLSQVQDLLKPLMLRRLKTHVESSMPPKTETKVLVPLSEYQRFWYTRLLAKDCGVLEQVEKAAEDYNSNDERDLGKQWKSLMSLMMQLRKCCQHPFLFPGAEPEPIVNSEDLIRSSGKMVVLDKLLKKLHAGGHRVLIFSQFIKMLDILEDYCALRDWTYTRLCGSTPRARRNLNIHLFNAKQSPTFIFLISTRAGGLGINLATADTVIFFDSDFNPQADLQAQDRSHRIGQTKEVRVYRLVSEATMEERMVARAEKKLLLTALMNSEGDESALNLSEKADAAFEILASIKFGADRIFNRRPGDDISDQDIDAILDRSAKLCKADAKSEESEDEDNAPSSLASVQTTTNVTSNPATSIVSMAMREFEGVNYSAKSQKEIAAEFKKKFNLEQGNGEYAAFFPTSEAPVHRLKPDLSSYKHEDICFICKDGGEVILCEKCPRIYHKECLGLDRVPPGKWYCPLHRCVDCGRSPSLAGGVLFWCLKCPNAYCDDHLPFNVQYVAQCEEHEELGFSIPNCASYVLCGGAECETFKEDLAADGQPNTPWKSLEVEVQNALRHVPAVGSLPLASLHGLRDKFEDMGQGSGILASLYQAIYQRKAKRKTVIDELLQWAGEFPVAPTASSESNPSNDGTSPSPSPSPCPSPSPPPPSTHEQLERIARAFLSIRNSVTSWKKSFIISASNALGLRLREDKCSSDSARLYRDSDRPEDMADHLSAFLVGPIDELRIWPPNVDLLASLKRTSPPPLVQTSETSEDSDAVSNDGA
mmetsp:Transcript_24530/g.40353  ORF Transcript_24530/g.40353 Transcript_24530/m.40353 type:complete len:1073 (-) Transcript_24530:180-3398(-)|eukprot:CAMPEP_0184665420 /NCGR_PEP_ID=MMETSP0308-20130426/57156_1 /TAXON_ID=38269 /ORGANISM="Gloeochaete witrockiana, Strain SAG 46.84" /LENGTH=1072 /DNA_ID=CAMNT_0027109409 /DNA_START=70 /DNA_END=3288 /DNA_ORIENTATION=+